MKTLIKIQKELKAPKSQRNTFGNYSYRNCEDILEAVKPLLGEATLLLTDDIVQIGDRYYVKATATIKEEAESVSVTAYARESEEKKGMDSAQITGASSSYARKYALNGLFLIDDTKDADSTNKHDGSAEIPKLELDRARLEGVTTPEELKKVWDSLPITSKKQLEKTKDALKAKFVIETAEVVDGTIVEVVQILTPEEESKIA